MFAEALSRLNVVIQDPNALQSDNVMAYDNAVSALGKICQFHRDSINSSQVLLKKMILLKTDFNNVGINLRNILVLRSIWYIQLRVKCRVCDFAS